MIRYALRCADGHTFDSWFQSAAAFDSLQASGHLACAICGSPRVEKGVMAPTVAGDTGEDESAGRARGDRDRPLSGDRSPAEQALRALRRHVEATAQYVGRDFAAEARAMHLGDVPERPIWGEARPEEARALAEDGIRVAPLPFGPDRKSN